MTAKNPEWYKKLVLGSMDKHVIHTDLVHKYVDASIYTAVEDSTNDCTVLIKGIYKVPSSGTPNYEELAAAAEEVYGDFISGTMMVYIPSEDTPAYRKPTSMTFDLTKADSSGKSPVVIGVAHEKSVTTTNGSEELIEELKCQTKEFYTAS